MKALAFGLMLLAACGGDLTATPEPAVTLSLSPTAQPLRAGGYSSSNLIPAGHALHVVPDLVIARDANGRETTEGLTFLPAPNLPGDGGVYLGYPGQYVLISVLVRDFHGPSTTDPVTGRTGEITMPVEWCASTC